MIEFLYLIFKNFLSTEKEKKIGCKINLETL